MKQLTPEEEMNILNECLQDGACEKLVRQYRNLIIFAVRKILIKKQVPYVPEDIEDFSNDIFVQIFRNNCKKLRQYREDPNHNLGKWILIISTRTVLNILRKKGYDSIGARNRRIGIEIIANSARTSGAAPGYDTEEAQHSIRKRLEKLQPRDRLILTMHYFKGVPLPEIASFLNMSPGAVYTARHRAVERLKQRPL